MCFTSVTFYFYVNHLKKGYLKDQKHVLFFQKKNITIETLGIILKKD